MKVEEEVLCLGVQQKKHGSKWCDEVSSWRERPDVDERVQLKIGVTLTRDQGQNVRADSKQLSWADGRDRRDSEGKPDVRGKAGQKPDAVVRRSSC